MFYRKWYKWYLLFRGVILSIYNCNNNNNNNQYIYKQRQSHAMSQRRWLATAVIFRPSDMSLGFTETWTVIAPATAETLEGGSRALVRRWRKPVDQWLSETAAPTGHSMTTSAAGDDPGCSYSSMEVFNINHTFTIKKVKHCSIVFLLTDCPPNSILHCRWSSLPGRRCSYLEESTTARHFCAFSSRHYISAENPLHLCFLSRTVLNLQCLWSDFVVIRHSDR